MDWTPIIIELQETLSLRQIAAKTGMASGGHVVNLRDTVGASCKYETGCALLELLRKEQKRRRTASLKGRPA